MIKFPTALYSSVRVVSFMAIIALMTGHAYLEAVLNDLFGDSIFPILILFSLLFFLCREKSKSWDVKFNRGLVSCFVIYLILSLISVYLPFSQWASIEWFNIAIFRLILAVLVAGLLIELSIEDITKIKIFMLCLLFVFLCVVLMDQLSIISKPWFEPLTPFPLSLKEKIKSAQWNEKFIANWIVVLCWGTIGVVWKRKSAFSNILVGIILVVSALAVFVLPSEGAMVAFACGAILFVLLNVFPLMKFSYLYIVAVFAAYIVPLVFLVFCIFNPVIPSGINPMAGKGGFERNIALRTFIYGHSCELIKEKPIVGYGVGSTTKLPYPQHSLVNKAWVRNRLPGGHPHNLFYLFLIEFGGLGAVFLASINVFFFKYLCEVVKYRPEAITALPLFVGFQIITSFSYAIWQADVVLLLLLFLLMMKLCLFFKESEVGCGPALN